MFYNIPFLAAKSRKSRQNARGRSYAVFNTRKNGSGRSCRGIRKYQFHYSSEDRLRDLAGDHLMFGFRVG